MRKALSAVLTMLGIGVCICAWPLYDTYTRYQHQTEWVKQEEARRNDEEATSIAALCTQYTRWQLYMLVSGYSKADYTTSMDKYCYDNSSN